MSVVSNENKEMLWDLIIDICNDNSFQVNGEDLKNFLDGRCGYYHGQRFEFADYDLNKIRHELLGEWKNFYLFFKKSLINEDENKLINIVNNESCKNLNKILTNTKYNIRYQNSFSLEDLISGIII